MRTTLALLFAGSAVQALATCPDLDHRHAAWTALLGRYVTGSLNGT